MIIFQIGYLILITATLLAAYGMLVGFVGGRIHQPALTASSANSVYAVAGLVAAAACILWYGLLTDQFQLSYVWNHSERALAPFYKFTAMWGGQSGSLLFWALILAGYNALVVATNRDKHVPLMPFVYTVIHGSLLFFLLLLVFAANPFVIMAGTPPDGRGLNPLLQNPWMVIHPVMLYLGYVGLSVPFAFAVAALLSRKLDLEWVRTVRRWTLLPWMFLSSGILMGSQWAYLELGWGGYWAWDPVENASFLPWLTATAFLHSIIIQEQRGILKVWNMLLIWLTYLLVILGTFTTRSGIIESVHSFARSHVGPYFLGFLIMILFLFLALLFSRLPLLRDEQTIDSFASREAAFMANNWMFTAIAFTTLWGTFYPMFSELLTGERISVAAPFFNKVNGPLFLLLMVLMGAGPLLGWGHTRAAVLRRQFAWPLVAAAAACVATAFTTTNGYPIVGMAVCAFVAATFIQEVVRGVGARRVTTGESTPVALGRLFQRNGRRYGGYLVHLAVVLIAVAVIGNEFYQTTTHRTLRQGEGVTLSGYELIYAGLNTTTQPNHVEHKARLLVYSAGDGRYLGEVTPHRNIYDKTPDMPTSEVGLRMTLVEDVYVVLNGWEEEGAQATFTIYVNPLMVWMWIGGGVLMLGTLIAAWPHAARGRA